MKIYKTFFIALQAFISMNSVAQAEINLQTGGYVRHFVDYRVQWQKQEFVIERTYRSRSLALGFFGLGWCSFMDEKLTFVKNEIEIDFCDDDTRLQLTTKGKNLWQSATGKIVKTKSGYALEDKAKGKRFYNAEGWLIGLGKDIEILRAENGNPLRLDIGLNRFQVQVDPITLKIVQISSNHLSKTEYKYNQNQLRQILQNKAILQSYLYDEDGNMIEIRSPSSTLEKIIYDRNQDRVTEWHPQHSCYFSYQYDQLNSLELLTRIFQSCKGRENLSAEVHFFYENLSATEVQLVRYESQPRTLASTQKIQMKRGQK